MLNLKNIVKDIYDPVLKYALNYLDKQAKFILQNNKTQKFPESKIEEFSLIKIPFHLFEGSNWENRFLSLKSILCETAYHVPIEVNEFVNHNDKCKFNYALEKKAFLFIWKILTYFISSYLLKIATELFLFLEATEK